MLWKNWSIDDASWTPAANFTYQRELKKMVNHDKPEEDCRGASQLPLTPLVPSRLPGFIAPNRRPGAGASRIFGPGALAGRSLVLVRGGPIARVSMGPAVWGCGFASRAPRPSRAACLLHGLRGRWRGQ